MRFILIFSYTVIYSCLIIFLYACGQQKAESQSITEIPLNPELHIIFEEDLSIGAAEGDENYMFGSRVFLNTDNEGNFYVTDWDKKTIKKYDSDGHFLKSIGRPGQGPGEFQDISEVKFDVEGNIYLNDISNQRISFLTKEGNYLKGIKTPQVFEGLLINSKGYYIAKHADNIALGKSKKWDFFYGFFDNKFNLIVELLRLPQEAKGRSKKGRDSIAQSFADYLSEIAFEPIVNYVQGNKGMIYFGYPKNYKIKVFSSEGKLLKIIQRDYLPREISKLDKEYFKQNLDRRIMAKMPAREEKKAFELIKYPKYKPAYERFTLMENGWIFVIVDSVRSEAKLVDIFNKNGEYLAQFETNVSTDWLSFNNGKAYAVATIDDYKFIKRYNFEILGYEEN